MNNFEEVEKTLIKALPDAKVSIDDLGGGNHLRIEVISKEFEGKSLINQHKMIYNILNNLMESNGGFIHALSIKTSTPKN
ncbi:MAG: ATP-binding protein [Candidatus Sericytochromatia bacterium]|nr:MAG: ATP-binding protein [Candidatus Sericytochromatia bacterium]